VQIVAGFGLKGIKPRVWDQTSPHYLKDLQAVMISYADFHKMPSQRKQAMEKGLHEHLGVPKNVKFYLDNGAFSFVKNNQEVPVKEYAEFVREAKPDWFPIPQDFIPTPKMTLEEQEECFNKTMNMNFRYYQGDYVPVVHISNFLEKYIEKIIESKALSNKPYIALGGIVPNLLRASKAIPHKQIIDNLIHFRQQFPDQKLHIFGIGGTATLHLAGLLGINSVDSSGWRNRAARGLIQLPGTGDRIISQLGNWRGRTISKEEEEKLKQCQCPGCKQDGLEGLKLSGGIGFYNRATHNLWVLLEEARQIQEHLHILKDYETWYQEHLDNTTYRPLIQELILELKLFTN
jgi:7-cyano-7-deazaguanine tRNA-ribosyltransferase